MSPHQTASAGAEIREDSGADSSVSPPADAPIAAPGTSRPVEQPPAEDDARQRSSAGMNLPQLGNDEDTSWRQYANCKGVNTRAFFADGLNDKSQIRKELEALCGACDVRLECLSFALRNNERGWWGGMSERGRRRIGRVPSPRARALSEIVHGTYAGYSKHRRRGETPCDECRQARDQYQREHLLRTTGRAS